LENTYGLGALGGLPVDDCGAQAADGVGEIDAVGVAEIVEAQDAFLRVGVGGEHMAAVDAGEQAAGGGRGEQAAVFLDEDVVDSGFSDFATVIQEQHIVVGGCASGLEGLRIERAMGGLVEVHGVGGVSALGGDADAERLEVRFGDGLGGDVEGAVGVEEEADFAGWGWMWWAGPRCAGMGGWRVGVGECRLVLSHPFR